LRYSRSPFGFPQGLHILPSFSLFVKGFSRFFPLFHK
jgi:hypothetical protein